MNINIKLKKKHALIVIPCFNEGHKLPHLFRELNQNKKNYFDYLIVDDNSDDGSNALIRSNGFNYLKNDKRMGIGYSIKRGLRYALDNDYSCLVVLAANGKMDPRELPNFTLPIINGDYDYIHGSRFLKKNTKISTPNFRKISIKILNYFFSIMFMSKISDSTCGYRSINVKKYKKFLLLNENKLFNTYGFEYYLYAKSLINKNIRIKEISIDMRYSTQKKNYTKIRPFIDWYYMIIPWIIARFDRKNLFSI